MKRELTCILCPRGCLLSADDEAGTWRITGNTCARGEAYGLEECTNPVRTVTGIVRVADREDVMVSVKTEAPVPKERMLETAAYLRTLRVHAPIRIGDVLGNAFGTRILATKEIL